MVAGGGMGSEEDKKKLTEDLVEFIGKRTNAEVPILTARLKSYVDLRHKRQRAEAARRHFHEKKDGSTRKRGTEGDPKEKTMENTDHPENEKDRGVKRHGRSRVGERHRSDSRSDSPSDRCCRRRRRRRRSCRRRRRRRRRRSCGRRRRRRRRRSCSRRRRRRSCKRRRRRCRRRRRRRRC